MNFEAIIGLEIHIELKTRSKMFSDAPIAFSKNPNSQVAPLDIAFPGAMPVVNKQAVIYGIQVAHILNMSIENELWFDRKNYFYSDLAKGYQITQHYRPLGKDGYLEINGNRINIKEMHLEEDTCKQIHQKEETLLDYNRSGIPLIEIVTAPDIRNGQEAKTFLEKIHHIVTSLGISDGKMENGSLRCDVNISLRPIGGKSLLPKVEIKNLNSFSNIKKAIDFEINRQNSLLLSGKCINSETRRFDESKQETIFMRNKVEEYDYRYFVEFNILPIKLTDEFINSSIKGITEHNNEKENLLKLGLSDKEVSLLSQDRNLFEYYKQIIAYNVSPRITYNWVSVDIKSILNKNSGNINNFNISPSNLAKLIELIQNGEISNKQAREIFDTMLVSNEDPNLIKEKLGQSLMVDEKALLGIIEEIIKDNPKAITDYRNGKDKVVGYISGLVMKKTKGNADPNLMNKLVIKTLRGN